MQLDELKKQWSSYNSNVQGAIDHDTWKQASRVASRRQKLMSTYCALGVLSVIFVVASPALLWEFNMPGWVYGTISLFFCLCAYNCFAMYSMVRRLDFSTMSVVELLRQIRRIYRRHIRQTIVGISLCIPVVAIMLYHFVDVSPAFWGGITGALIGSIIGAWRNHSIRRTLREINDELADV
ncbi:MAG: hypothetical protein NC111_03580 [Bacteroides sp.]|nr:hypothetical protein [Bacteroides sp.]MCM1412925.1 hypothetical protein [Bacteroides sp.]MCM1471594.1 hypothetical protein [Bacteroides sp.]